MNNTPNISKPNKNQGLRIINTLSNNEGSRTSTEVVKNKLSKKEILSKTKLEFYKEIKKYQRELKPSKEIEGYASTSLVGEHNYPTPKTYSISNENKENSFFKANQVVKKDYSEIVKLKAHNVLGSTNNTYIKKTNTKILSEISDIYKSKKETNFASKFDKELKFNKPIFNKLAGVLGTKNELLNIEATENTSTSKQIEKYTTTDIKSKEAIINLYERNTPEYQIINLLALGNFGLDINKKLVPTRWAITAYDQTIEKHLLTSIKQYKPINEFELYYSSDKGNTFLLIYLPDTYTFENFEFTSDWQASDYVDHKNKLKTPEPNSAGAFFAAKVAIFEHLKKRKRQAQIICFRYIEDYDIPLGVVFVREMIREATKNQIFKTSSKKELEQFLKHKQPKFLIKYLTSQTIRENNKQKKLRDWI